MTSVHLNFDLARLGQAIHQAFGIPILSLEYLPVGMVGRHFKVQAAGGEFYFITLYDDTRLARIAASKLDFTLPLVARLHHQGGLHELMPPLPALDGSLRVNFDGGQLLVYPYIDGHLLAEEMPLNASTWSELGRLVARIHAATPLVEGIANPIRETFTFPFEAPLIQGLQALRRVRANERRGRVALQNLLLPEQGMIMRLLERLHQLAEPLRSTPPAFVICHTDLHLWNVIRKGDGRLLVVDWEGACLAPPECDLFIFTGEGFLPLLQAYVQAGGSRSLEACTFAFYLVRRNLEDLTDYIVRILDENTDPDTDHADLEGVRELLADGRGLEGVELNLQAFLAAV